MISWIELILMIAKTLAIVSGVGFAIAEHRTKRRYFLGLIISGGLALAAQLSEWGLALHRASGEKATLVELTRARYPFRPFGVVITLRVSLTEPSIARYKAKWDSFLEKAVVDPKPWQHIAQSETGGLTLSDEQMKVRVDMSQDRKPMAFHFEEDSELVDEIPDADGYIWQDLHSIMYLVLTKDIDNYLSHRGLFDEERNCDLALLLTPIISTTHYTFTYFPRDGLVEIVAKDEEWPVKSDTGAITSYVDLPGYVITIVTRYSDANIGGLFLSGGDPFLAEARNLSLGGDDFVKRHVDGTTIFGHKIAKKDFGVLRIVDDELLGTRR
jgi:hypothetical protein